MTSTNHVLTGAAIALAVKQPALAIPLALASHFALDALPHFGIYEDDRVRRNASRWFRTVVSIDVPAMLFLLFFIPMQAPVEVGSWTIFASMVAGLAPDLVWLPQFFKEIRTKRTEPNRGFAAWHQKIQWYEHPPGLLLEAAWLAIMTYVITRLLQ